MKNSDYWKQRFTQLEEAQNKIGEIAVKKIEQLYRTAQKQMEAEIAVWYQRFAVNNGITLAEARKWLTGDDLEELKWDVQEYIKRGEENAISGAWKKQLENASAKYHISRLEALKIRAQQSLEVLYGQYGKTITDALSAVYESGYYHTAYELQKGFGVGWDIAGLDQRQIEKVLAKPWAADAYNFSERIWKNKDKLINEVHNTLTQNILRGQDPQKAIDAIAKKMQTSKYNAGRLVMTEEAYFSSAAQKEAFDELGVEQYEIVATLDTHTSDICRSLDGKVYPMKDYEAGVTAPPFHVWCRSTTAPYFEDDFGEIGERAARDEEGNTYYVPADTTFEQWKQMQDEKYGAGSVDKLRQMAYNESADRKQYESYKNRLGADAPQTFNDFQSLKYNSPTKYEELFDFYSYKGRVPEATFKNYKDYRTIKGIGIIGSVRVPPKPIDTTGIIFNDEHAKRHGCTLEQAIGYIKNANCSITRKRWDGYHTCYYSKDGAAYVEDKTNRINTAFSKKDFDFITKKIMEVFE